MYDLPYHKENDEKLIREFIDQHPFALLVGCDSGNSPVVTQVPVFLEESNGRQILTGHIMRKTDHHKAFLHNDSALVVFTSPHTYVSASWYSNPHQGSTWNYMSVHVRGKLRFLDESGLARVLRKTSLHFEAGDRDSPTVFDNLPAAYKEKMLKAVVAFEIDVTSIDNVFKLSQDRSEESFRNIIGRLGEQGESSRFIAEEMKKRAKAVFSGK